MECSGVTAVTIRGHTANDWARMVSPCSKECWIVVVQMMNADAGRTPLSGYTVP